MFHCKFNVLAFINQSTIECIVKSIPSKKITKANLQAPPIKHIAWEGKMFQRFIFKSLPQSNDQAYELTNLIICILIGADGSQETDLLELF